MEPNNLQGDKGDEVQIPWKDYEMELQSLCIAKSEEFHLLGYDKVTPEEVWACVQAQLKGTPRLHEVVASLLSLRVDKFMNYMTMNAYRGAIGEDIFTKHS